MYHIMVDGRPLCSSKHRPKSHFECQSHNIKELEPIAFIVKANYPELLVEIHEGKCPNWIQYSDHKLANELYDEWESSQNLSEESRTIARNAFIAGFNQGRQT